MNAIRCLYDGSKTNGCLPACITGLNEQKVTNMENGSMDANRSVKVLDNVLYIEAVPLLKTAGPFFTLFPVDGRNAVPSPESTEKDGAGEDPGAFAEEKLFEAFEIVFDEDFGGDLSVKICSLMAEDFLVFIDGEEYSYAVKGAKQTDPGFAMIAGPFERGTVVACRWGRPSAGVYTQEDVGNVEAPEQKKEDKENAAVIPFFIKGAQSVVASKAFGIVLADAGDASEISVSPCKDIPLEADGTPAEGEIFFKVPEEAAYSSEEVTAGGKQYHLVIGNPKNKKGSEEGPDAFMNVTGSFAGELCYKIGNIGEPDAHGTYHTSESQKFCADPVTGYLWGSLDGEGTVLAFQVEEGLYGINAMLPGGASSLVVKTPEKEKAYPLPEGMPTDGGPTAMTIRVRTGNGMITVKSVDKDGNDRAVEGLEIRTLSTTAHASDFVPVEMPDENVKTKEVEATKKTEETVGSTESWTGNAQPMKIRVSVYSRSEKKLSDRRASQKQSGFGGFLSSVIRKKN